VSLREKKDIFKTDRQKKSPYEDVSRD
jgi:hypothetical protein